MTMLTQTPYGKYDATNLPSYSSAQQFAKSTGETVQSLFYFAHREHLNTRNHMFWNAILENYQKSESNQKIILNSLRKEDNVIHQVMYLILK